MFQDKCQQSPGITPPLVPFTGWLSIVITMGSQHSGGQQLHVINGLCLSSIYSSPLLSWLWAGRGAERGFTGAFPSISLPAVVRHLWKRGIMWVNIVFPLCPKGVAFVSISSRRWLRSDSVFLLSSEGTVAGTKHVSVCPCEYLKIMCLSLCCKGKGCLKSSPGGTKAIMGALTTCSCCTCCCPRMGTGKGSSSATSKGGFSLDHSPSYLQYSH